MEKSNLPDDNDVKSAIGDNFNIWQKIKDYVYQEYPAGKEEWNFPGKKYGWSFRIKDKKRAILYFLPRDGYFKVGFVFGQKACDYIAESDINKQIITNLMNAKKYAEGRGVIFEADSDSLSDIKKLIKVKLMF